MSVDPAESFRIAAESALAGLATRLVPEAKLTLVWRVPGKEDCYQIIGDDDVGEVAKLLEQADYQEGLARHLAEAAEDCTCCPRCWSVPCGGCLQGGVCEDACDCGNDDWCAACNNSGQVDCRCGGDLCVCENYGEKPCPRCG